MILPQVGWDRKAGELRSQARQAGTPRNSSLQPGTPTLLLRGPCWSEPWPSFSHLCDGSGRVGVGLGRRPGRSAQRPWDGHGVSGMGQTPLPGDLCLNPDPLLSTPRVARSQAFFSEPLVSLPTRFPSGTDSLSCTVKFLSACPLLFSFVSRVSGESRAQWFSGQAAKVQVLPLRCVTWGVM